MTKEIMQILIIFFTIIGCSTVSSPSSGNFGDSGYKNVVILGENVNSETAEYYANKYNARVLYKPGRGFLADVVNNSLRGTIGPSRAMKDVINELKNMNNTEGTWRLIIPSSAERYFLVTLRNMDDNAVANAHGQIIFPEFKINKKMEKEIFRVFGKNLEIIE